MDRRRFLATSAAGSLALVTEPLALAARLGGSPIAYVTADLESHVVVLDPETTKVLRRIRTAPGPRSIESVHDRLALVAHTEHGLVTLVDAASARVRAEVAGLAAPRYAAVHPRASLAYVTDSVGEEVVVVDAERARVVWRTRVPGPARHIGIGPNGHALWTSLGNAAARIAVLDASDPRRPRLVRTIAPLFPAHDVVFAPDGRAVWVTSGSERRIALYGRDERLLRVLPADAPPQHVTFARRKAFVSAGDDGTLRRHRLDGTRVHETRVPVGSYNVAFGLGHVVMPSLASGTVALLDRNGRVRTITRVARAAHDACIVFGP